MTEAKHDSGKPGGRAQEIAGETEEQPEKERGSKAQGHVLSLGQNVLFVFCFVFVSRSCIYVFIMDYF